MEESYRKIGGAFRGGGSGGTVGGQRHGGATFFRPFGSERVGAFQYPHDFGGAFAAPRGVGDPRDFEGREKAPGKVPAASGYFFVRGRRDFSRAVHLFPGHFRRERGGDNGDLLHLPRDGGCL